MSILALIRVYKIRHALVGKCIRFGKRTNLNKAVTNPRTISKFVHEISQYLLFRDANPPLYIKTPSIASRISNNVINTII